MEEIKRSRGAQPGNQNARTHGFYSAKLDEMEQHDFLEAVLYDGIDDEIALLRVKLKSVIANDPQNIRLIMQLIGSIDKALGIRIKLGIYDKKGAREAFSNVLHDIVIPLGFAIDIGKSLFNK